VLISKKKPRDAVRALVVLAYAGSAAQDSGSDRKFASRECLLGRV
jgi:hypothetical protein